MPILILTGPPGVGKTTTAEMLAVRSQPPGAVAAVLSGRLADGSLLV